MKKIFMVFLLFLGGFLILSQQAIAVTTDVPAGTIITAEGYDVYINYKDSALNPKATVYGTTLEAVVLPIYGLSGPGTPADQYTEPSAPVYYVYQIFNEGNETDTYSISLSSPTYNGNYGNPWTFQIIRDENNNGVVDPEDVNTTSEVVLTEDGSAYFFLKVTPSSNAGDGSSATITVTITTESTPAGQYIGANGNTYGGPSYVQDETTTYINAPVLTMTKVATVDAPNSYRNVVNDGSRDHDPVPGSVITYTILYTNEGNADARDVIIKEKINPFGTVEAGHVNATGQKEGNLGNVNISAPQSTATGLGWFVYYSTFEAPSPTGYDGSQASHGDWVLLGELVDSSSMWWADSTPSLPLTARWLKWETATVEAQEDGTLTFGVIIR